MSDEYDISRRKVLAGLGTIGVAGAGAGLGTSAYFSDQETFTNNQLVAGSLDMKVGATHHYVDWLPDTAGGPEAPQETDDAEMPETDSDVDIRLVAGQGGMDTVAEDIELDITDATGLANGSVVNTVNGGASANLPCDGTDDADGPVLIDLGDVKPGDFGLARFCFRLCDNPGYVWLDKNLVNADENGVTEPEGDDPDEVDGVVELLDEVQVAVVDGDAANLLGSNLSPPLEITPDATLRQFLNGGPLALDGDIPAEDGGGTGRDCFEGGSKSCVTVVWWLPVDHANEIQSDSVTFDLGFYTEQCRHNDGSGQFGNNASPAFDEQ